MLVASDGNARENNRVFPFGEPWNTLAESNNKDTFTTYQRDQESGEVGLDYAMARYYASRSGRFMTADPAHIGGNVGDPQSWNAYAYALNDPINFIDPTGTEGCRDQEELEGQGLTCGYWRNLLDLILFSLKNMRPQEVIIPLIETTARVIKDTASQSPAACTATAMGL